jgi:putative flippase GtrA
MRFGIVGGISGLIFAATTALLISEGRVDATLSSIIGYVVSMPVNFFANRSFSFRSQGNILSDAIRYTVLQVVNMAASAGAMQAATNTLGLHYLFGIAGAIVLVPLTSFLLMEVWVFGRPARATASRLKSDAREIPGLGKS